jgi:hypothetical protein
MAPSKSSTTVWLERTNFGRSASSTDSLRSDVGMNVQATAASRHLSHSGLAAARTARWVTIAGSVYISAWIIGLFAAPAAPDQDASASTVHAYYLDHAMASFNQSLLVHGLAGIALIGLAWSLPKATKASASGTLAVRWFGYLAALVSFAQVGFAVFATHNVEETSAATSRTLFETINTLDTVKLVFLAGFVATATVMAYRARMAPKWMRWLATALIVLLPLGGLEYVAGNLVFEVMLDVALLGLLLWAAACATVIAKRAQAH